MLKRITIILLLIIQLLTLSSCFDAVEVDNSIHILTIGVDKGVSDKWRLTLQFSTMRAESGSQNNGGSGDAMSASNNEDKQKQGEDTMNDQGGYSYITVDGPSFFGCMDLLNTCMSGRINFTHAQFIVFSKELAESGLIGEFIAPIIRFKEIRRTMQVIVTRGSALDYIKENKPYIGSSLSKSMYVLLSEAYETGYFPRVTLQDFYNGLKSNDDQAIATLVAVNEFDSFQKDGEKFGSEFKIAGDYLAGEIPRQGGKKVDVLGTAVFDGDTMVGELTGDETRSLLMITNKFESAIYTIQDPRHKDLVVPIKVKLASKPKVKVLIKENKTHVKLNINLEGDILAIQSRINYEDPEFKKELEESFKNEIEDRLSKLIEKCKNMKTDILQFGRHACKYFPTIQDWEKFKWHEKFKDIEVDTHITFTIRRTGSQQRSSSFQSSKGSE